MAFLGDLGTTSLLYLIGNTDIYWDYAHLPYDYIHRSIPPMINPVDSIQYDTMADAQQHKPSEKKGYTLGLYQRYIAFEGTRFGARTASQNVALRYAPKTPHTFHISGSLLGIGHDITVTANINTSVNDKILLPLWYWSQSKNKTWTQHFTSEVLPAMAIFAAPAIIASLPAAAGAAAAAAGTAAGTGATVPTAGGLTMSEIAAGAGTAAGAGAGTAAATGGGILSTIAAALPSAGTLETVASGAGTVVGTAQKVMQAEVAKKQAAQQMAQAQQTQQQMAQAQAAQDIAAEVQNTVQSGLPITQDLVNRAAKAGIKLSTTGTMTPITEASIFAGISSKNVPYLIGVGIALTIVYYLFIEKKK